MLREKNYVYAVYKEQSFSKAAGKLFITQPALSAAVRRAEERVGSPLFDRSTLPIRLTPAGEYYIRQARQVMEIEREMEEYFHLTAQEQNHTLSIGASTFFCAMVLPSAVEGFCKKFPDRQVSIVERDAPELEKQLHAGSIDCTIEVEQRRDKRSASYVIGEESILLAVPRSFAVNDSLTEYGMTFEQVRDGWMHDTKARPVKLARFSQEPFLFLKRGNDSYARGMRMCRRAGFEPKVAMYLDQLLTSYYVACGGSGIAFVRAGLPRYVDATDKLVFYKIDDPMATRAVRLYVGRASAHRPAVRDFLSYVQEEPILPPPL